MPPATYPVNPDRPYAVYENTDKDHLDFVLGPWADLDFARRKAQELAARHHRHFVVIDERTNIVFV